MGGATQPQGHAQIVINIIDFGMNLQEAGDAPRILHNGSSQPTREVMTDGGTLQLESGIDYEVIRKLVLMGHQISWNVGSFGGYQAIMRDDVNKVYMALLSLGKMVKLRAATTLLFLYHLYKTQV